MRGDFELEAFYAALDSHRRALGLTWKDVAEKSGVNASTLTRMSQGKRPDIDGLAGLLAWSGLNAHDFIRTEPVTEPQTLARIAALLRADPKLRRKSAEAIEEIVQAAYRNFRED